MSCVSSLYRFVGHSAHHRSWAKRKTVLHHIGSLGSLHDLTLKATNGCVQHPACGQRRRNRIGNVAMILYVILASPLIAQYSSQSATNTLHLEGAEAVHNSGESKSGGHQGHFSSTSAWASPLSSLLQCSHAKESGFFVKRSIGSAFGCFLAFGFTGLAVLAHGRHIRTTVEAGLRQGIRDNLAGVRHLRRALLIESKNISDAADLLGAKSSDRPDAASLHLSSAVGAFTEANWRAVTSTSAVRDRGLRLRCTLPWRLL